MKMKQMKDRDTYNFHRKGTATAACLLCLAALLGACGDTAEAPVQTEAQTDAETTAAVTEEVRLYQDSLPADLDTEGKTLRLMSGYSDGSTFHSMLTPVEANEGELVNDAMHEANLAITERFGITVNPCHNVIDIVSGIDRLSCRCGNIVK